MNEIPSLSFARWRVGAVVLSLLVAAAMFPPGTAWAQAAGTVGVDGADGAPGQPGGDGSDGGAARLPAAGDPPPTTGTATGGRGGAGGDGGAPDGAGGDGGRGGSAEAEAVSCCGASNAFSSATASGGDGGWGGAAGGAEAAGGSGGRGGDATARASGGGIFGATVTATATGGRGGGGATGAPGGDASASAAAGESASSAFVRLTANARGGVGGGGVGAPGGRGGDALATIEQADVEAGTVRATISATGGSGSTASIGGRGGNATSRGDVSATGEVIVNATSSGGQEGRSISANASGDAGGDAVSSARATSSTGDATATAGATGGKGTSADGVGQRSGDGGTIEVAAHATALGAGAQAVASVTALGGAGGAAQNGAAGGDGASVILVDVVSGSGSAVSLTQSATGGRAGRVSHLGVVGAAGRGGEAVSELEASNTSGDLSLVVRARGGSGEGSHSRAGDASASADAEASGDVTIRVEASAGQNDGIAFDGPTAERASAEIRRARGVSTGGGDVSVIAELWAASGTGSEVDATDGGDAILVDVADGSTTGALFLQQTVQAGSGGSVSRFAPTQSAGGEAGDAINRLDRSKSAASLTGWLRSTAGGGAGEYGSLATNGGAALSELMLRNDAGEVVAEAAATGGAGSDSEVSGLDAADGGEGRVIVRAVTEGDGHAIRVGARSDSVAAGGRGGDSSRVDTSAGDGGLGFADVRGEALGDSIVDVIATARGGSGGDGESGDGDGGRAEAHAFGSNAGSSRVSVAAIAFGGEGGDDRPVITGGSPNGLGGDGGEALATARGESSGGGDVTVSVELRPGFAADGGVVPDAVVTDAVSGATTGTLRLVQAAIGTDSSDGSGSAGRSSLTFVDDDGGALELESIARGGRGGRNATDRGGAAEASASGIGRDDVEVTAEAVAGGVSNAASSPGAASLGVVYGESTGGGHVRVEGRIEAAGGEAPASNAVGATAGSGSDATLENAVAGSTAGVLELIQQAVAGGAGSYRVGQQPGQAGEAVSRLDRTHAGAALIVSTTAVAGRGSDPFSEGPRPGTRFDASDGGAAEAETIAMNSGGRVEASAFAEGGIGGVGRYGSQGGNGGRAVVRVFAETDSPEGDIEVEGLARGGWARLLPTYNNPGLAGIGGEASSTSTGRALGEGRVVVEDVAIGGEGARGGDATSTAMASNLGAREVRATSHATGGDSSDPSGQAGLATANASAFSFAGAATAEAAASGHRGFASANAGSSFLGQTGDRVVATGLALASGTASSSARAEIRSEPSGLPFPLPREDVAVVVGASRTEETGVAGVLMNVRQDDASEDLDITLSTSATLAGLELESYEGWAIAVASGSVVSAGGFEELVFRVSHGSDVLVDETATDAATADLLFGTVFDLASLTEGLDVSELELRFSLELRGASSGSRAWVFLDVTRTVIPEPGTALLVGMGLIVLSRRGAARGAR